jgi:putative heme-binding domain-containing protein
LETVANPPVIQMLMPGFTVHELPVKLSNLNNVRYRADGKLVALGYDGRIHLLTDTDGDGLEDRATIFWEKPTMRAPIGMALLPANDSRGDGVFVASKGKVSLFLDRDRDGRADEEIVAATGWKEGYAGVDTTGVAVDPKDGSVYFSISCESFVDGYVRDPQGVSRYSTTSDRGTVQRLAKDFSKRESIVTGVRFLCSLAFNAEGDLFATEQEGATWLPNGNPLDELLEIVPGRHYGFPPRHPKHLPNVIDEPAVMEYGPQHQSTVGMVFNDSVNGGPTFGPARWKGDALITGESRGKIYRTKLVKTAAGYVADNQLIACLSLLTVDNCVTPQGDLVVACHSGPPDWGTGPAGEGKLFKVRYARPEVPQIARAWAAAPDEFRIAFDKPLTAADWAGAREKIRIEAGKHVSAGDRFESIRPGYQVVRDQMAAPRRWVEAQSLSLSGDQRTLILHVPRQTEAVTYAVTLPCPPSWRATGEGLKGIEQHPEMDVAIALHGIEATLEEGPGTAGAAAIRNAKVILPHANLQAARAFTIGSAEHEAFFARLEKADAGAKLKLRGGVDTSNIFVPETQAGATLDWDIAENAFANRRMRLRQDFSSALNAELPTALTNSISLELPAPVNQRGKGLTFALDDKERTIRGNRLFAPWASQSAATNELAAARSDVHGNWLRGKRLFFGQAACATCHTVRGEGIKFGPDLSNLLFRDRESVLVDIAQPSATINPDHAGSYVKFKDGLELIGLVETLNDEKIVVRLAGGVEETRGRAEVETILPLKTSLMPEGLGAAFSTEQMEDLLTFLLAAPMEPAPISRLDPPAPPARTRAEIAPFLKPSLAEAKPMRILLCAGPKDHGVDEHDYPLWLARWSRLLAMAENVTIATNVGFPSREKLSNADVTVFFSANPGWDLNAAAALDEYQKRGGGLVYLHWAVEGGKEAKALAERIGLATAFSAFRHGVLDLNFTGVKHPITQGFSKLTLLDESYWKMHGDVARIQTLADSVEENAARPQLWTLEREKGRVFGCIPGHYTWTFDDPLYRILVLRGIAWAGQESNVDRFNELATIGARIAQ